MKAYIFTLRLVATIAVVLSVTGCTGSSQVFLSPARYSADSSKVWLPLPIAIAYEQCATSAVLYHEGVWEFVGNPPQAAILDWATGKSTSMPLPGGDGMTLYSFSQSADCRTIAVSDGTSVYLYDIANAVTTKWTEGKAPAYSPDGAQMALLRGSDIMLKNVANGEETVLELPSGLVSKTSFLSDLYWGGTGSTLIVTITYRERKPFGEDSVLLNLGETISASTIFQSTGEIISAPAMSPDGQYVAYVLQDVTGAPSTLWLYDGAQACFVASREAPDAFGVHWSRDGETLLVTKSGTEESADFVSAQAVLREREQSGGCLEK